MVKSNALAVVLPGITLSHPASVNDIVPDAVASTKTAPPDSSLTVNCVAVNPERT